MRRPKLARVVRLVLLNTFALWPCVGLPQYPQAPAGYEFTNNPVVYPAPGATAPSVPTPNWPAASPAAYSPPYATPVYAPIPYPSGVNPAVYAPPQSPPQAMAPYGPMTNGSMVNAAVYSSPNAAPAYTQSQNPYGVNPAAYWGALRDIPQGAATAGSAPVYPPPGGNPRPFESRQGDAGMALAVPEPRAPSCEHETKSAEKLFLTNIGVRFGAFVPRDSVMKQIYNSFPTFGIDLKHHLGSSPFAVSTSLDFFGGQGNALTLGDAVGTTRLAGFDWRLTALLEPPPGAWGSADGSIYFNPYLGAGLGYFSVSEELTGTVFDMPMAASATLGGLSYHAILGIDMVVQRRLAVGVSLLSTGFPANTGLRGDVDLGGETVCFNLNWRF